MMTGLTLFLVRNKMPICSFPSIRELLLPLLMSGSLYFPISTFLHSLRWVRQLPVQNELQSQAFAGVRFPDHLPSAHRVFGQAAPTLPEVLEAP